ncbi:amidohydrolase family protein [Parahaliea mediterranea]|nr:amidohydrolase family protein [Parahaliea mediterranea]
MKTLRQGFLAALMLPHLVLAGQPEPGEEVIDQVAQLGIPAPEVAPPSGAERSGPYRRLVIKNANMIDGTGAPVQGPVTIVVENDRIVELRGGGTGSFHPGDGQYDGDTRVIDATGQYVLPGFVDAHAHLGSPSHALVKNGALTAPDYVTKLWLAHGITTIREPGALMGLDWTLKHRELSDAGVISAPRMKVHALFPETMSSPAQARQWVRAVRKKGADGIKFIGAAPEAIEAAIAESRKLKMHTMYHHSQITVNRMNVLDSARMGLDSMEHWYGLPEAMFTDRQVQDYPDDYNYNNEQDRFAQAGRLWKQAAKPGSEVWKAVIDELLGLDFTLDPTFTIYESNRDLMRARRAVWLDDYAMPYINRAFLPNPHVHGSFHFDWTTADEVAWKENYKLWMSFVNDYKNAGGRVTAGSDSGFIHGLYGFGYVRELELLQEAGFHPLEVIQAATLNGAELLDMADDTGSIQIGKKADLIIVNENPLSNLKVLYASGHESLNLETGERETSRGVLYTIKDGIVYDADVLRAQIKTMVSERKAFESGRAGQERFPPSE